MLSRRIASILVALGSLAFAAVPAQALTTGQRFGFDDQNGTVLPAGLAAPDAPAANAADIYTDPRVMALQPTITRFVADFDIALTPGPARDQLDAWYAVGQARGLDMLISFQAFMRPVPSRAVYRAGLEAFRARYPQVLSWAPMNEANYRTQPTAKSPRLAASYTKIARTVCPPCTLVQATILTVGNDVGYARALYRALPRSEQRRMIWGLHAYGDANRGSSQRLVRFLRNIRVGQIWITEAAAWAQFAPPKWPWNLRRQANATTTVFRQALAGWPRITRLYWYEWSGTDDPAARWDSGLVGPTGDARPALAVAMRERFRRRLNKSQLRQAGLGAVSRAARRAPAAGSRR